MRGFKKEEGSGREIEFREDLAMKGRDGVERGKGRRGIEGLG